MARFERAAADWLPYEEALRRILAEAVPTPAESVAVDQALGRRLARGAVARATLPAWDNSAMDGFAVRRADVEEAARAQEAGAGIRLPVAGRAYPGDLPLQDVARGSAVRIMTGAPLPAGFDSVVRVEHTDGEAQEGVVVLRRTDDLGRHVRKAGRDMTAGAEAAPVGAIVHSGSLAVLLACGETEVSVRRRPRVGVLSSGSELAGPDRFDEVAGGRAVPDTNRGMIAAAVAEAGGAPVDLGIAPDDADAVRRRLRRLDETDALVITGGASMGEKDLVKRALVPAGLQLRFWRARIRPGSPVSFGLLPRRGGERDVPVFGLPGNPASAFVTFHVLVAPFVRAVLGSPEPGGTFAIAVAGDDLPGSAGTTQFPRVRLDRSLAEDMPRCRLCGPQGSGLVRSLRDADALAVLPEDTERIERGEQVRLMLLAGAGQ